HSARAGLTGLLFIATSALLPAFFLILAVTAGPLLNFHPDAWAIGLFYILLLPALNALVLFAVVFSAPSMAGSWRPAQLREQVVQTLASYGLPPLTLGQLALAGAALAAIGLCFAVALMPGSLGLVLALSLGLLPLLLYALLEGRAISDTASIESELPHLLLSGASTARFSLEKMLETAARSPSAALRAQSQESLRSLQAGTNPVSVLSGWAARTPSVMLERALRLLQVGYSTGGSMAKALRETAADLFSSFALMQERASLLSVQRYTLLAAAGLLVPAILGLSLSFSAQVQSIGLSTGASAIFSGDNSTRIGASAQAPASAPDTSSPLPFASGSPSILKAALLSIGVYLLLNALLTAFFLSLLQGTRERFVPYAAMLILLSQAVWLLLAPAI
ncbi:MAG: type II secretion system F family protein, partial [Candidatus Micrarchaeota archaeon]|nr:type II secretion system F family protein [Candidatus Micrarchaeota archaeon]